MKKVFNLLIISTLFLSYAQPTEAGYERMALIKMHQKQNLEEVLNLDKNYRERKDQNLIKILTIEDIYLKFCNEIFDSNNKNLDNPEGEYLRYQFACKIFKENLDLGKNSNFFYYFKNKFKPNFIISPKLSVKNFFNFEPIILKTINKIGRDKLNKNNNKVVYEITKKYIEKLAEKIEQETKNPSSFLNSKYTATELEKSPIIQNFENFTTHDITIPGKIAKPFYDLHEKHPELFRVAQAILIAMLSYKLAQYFDKNSTLYAEELDEYFQFNSLNSKDIAYNFIFSILMNTEKKIARNKNHTFYAFIIPLIEYKSSGYRSIALSLESSHAKIISLTAPLLLIYLHHQPKELPIEILYEAASLTITKSQLYKVVDKEGNIINLHSQISSESRFFLAVLPRLLDYLVDRYLLLK